MCLGFGIVRRSIFERELRRPVLFLQEADCAGVHRPVHIAVLCYYNSQLQGNAQESDRPCKCNAPVDVSLCHAPTGVLEEAFTLLTVHLWRQLGPCPRLVREDKFRRI